MADPSVTVTAHVLGSNRTFGMQKDNITYGYATVGPNNTNTSGLRFTITGLNLPPATPNVILFQPRQSVNQDNGWSDEFAVQIIDTTATQISGRVMRLDNLNIGWGQQLRLDFLIIL
jgi:hypothetical protein